MENLSAPDSNAPDLGALLYAYYGDDFTGSTDVLEALALYGLPAVLFLGLPEERTRKDFAHCKAFGIAGESRSHSPEWMTENLPAIFRAMREWGAPVNHYKVCSTFDSGPHVGSIGRAMELGLAAFDAKFAPIVVCAPHLGRVLAYGNLFAAADGAMYRIDRHPTMSRHPVTPMLEADLRLHLALQTQLPIGLVDLESFEQDMAKRCFDNLIAEGARGILFDGISEIELDETAQLIWERARQHPVFAVGSSGLSHGLLRCWQRDGWMEDVPELPHPVAADRLLVLSGSCSPVTRMQIQAAGQQGFALLPMAQRNLWENSLRQAEQSLARGQSVVLFTALGEPDEHGTFGEEFSAALGEELHRLVLSSDVRRVVVAGGDTSTHAVKQLRIAALTFAAPLAPGVPLCRAYAPGSPIDGLELALKGGQVGTEGFFAQVRDGL